MATRKPINPEPIPFPIHLNYTITGKIVADNGTAVIGVSAIAYDKRVGGDVMLGQGTSDATGSYTITFSSVILRGMAQPDIEVDVTVPNAAAVIVIARSDIRYNAGLTETIDVIVSSANVPRASEYDRLIADLTPHLDSVPLANLQENGVTNHITLLSNKTGWDARVVAMAAQASVMSNQTQIPPVHYYAIFRAGISTDQETFSRLSSDSLLTVLNTAVQNKVIPDGTDIQGTIKLHDAQSINFLLQDTGVAGISSLGAMLSLSLNGDQQRTFAQSYRDAAGDSDQLWANLKEKNVAPQVISKLQLDGKLGYLTMQNAAMVKRLYGAFNITDPVDLVANGLYKPEAWTQFIGTDVVPGISADDYAQSMANQLNLSYPTAVVAQMAMNKEITLPAVAANPDVYNFMMSSSKLQSNIGQTPVKQWQGFEQLKPEMQDGVKQLERIYQLSPSNASMTALANLKLTSAYQVVQYTRDQFVEKFHDSFPSVEEATLVYNKSQQVYSSVTSIASAYITNKQFPNVYVLTGSQQKTDDGTIAYPTLDDLFGDMDYCACDECKSVLGAAAYMVDLLQFIDLTGKTFVKQNPQDVLFGRRPDLQHMQLTCENTNTPLPQIDIVNEILEYYIVNGGISTFTGHDISEDTDPNALLADPQFVIAGAYTQTYNKVYPYNLPFDLSREALRLFFAAWGTTLETALKAFSNQLASRKERLGLNLSEYDILTNINTHTLSEYYGLAAGATIAALNAAVANGKAFSQGVNITYDELVRLLKTQFINPGTILVPALDQLQLGLDQIQAFYDGTLSNADLNSALPAGLDLTVYGGNVGSWLTANKMLITRLILLTDINPGNDECSLAGMELRYANPDMSTNMLDDIAYNKFHSFIRLWKKAGWTLETTDLLLGSFSPTAAIDISDVNIDAAFVTILARMANFSRLAELVKINESAIPAILVMWDVTADLTLRQTICAQLLKLSIDDMLDLAKIAGVDPLAMDLETDIPAFLQLLQLLADLKSIPVKVADLDYLLMHKDPLNKLTIDDATLLKQIKSLRDAITAVEKENSAAPDNADLSFAKAKMNLVYDSIVTDILFSLLTNSKIYTAALDLPEDSLPTPLTADPQVGYDAFRKQLIYTGILTAAAETNLTNAANALTLADMHDVTVQADLDAFKAAFISAVQSIKADGDDDLATLNASYPELKALYDLVTALPTLAEQTSAIIANILPALITKLKETALQQVLMTITRGNADAITVLTGDPAVLHGVSDTSKNVLNDFQGLETALDISANQIYNAYLDPSASDNFILYVKAPAGTTVTLTINGSAVISGALVGATNEVQSALPVVLQVGSLVSMQLTIAGLPAGGVATLWWRTNGMAKVQVPDSNIYLKASVDEAKTSLVRITKAVQLQQLFGLTAPELAYFAATSADTQNMLNDLSVDATISNADLATLWKKVDWMVFFSILKRNTQQDDNTWLQILQQPTIQTPQGKSILLDMNSWQQADVDDVLTSQGKTWNDLSSLAVLKTTVQQMQLVTTINFPASLVLTWAVDNPDKPLIDGIKAAVRQANDDAAWLATMESVSNVLRNKQRDALVSYILQYQQPNPEVNTPDKLYEYFLIDVEMDACMMTSRIVQATAAIQLFIFRCLMNLEPDVDPASINASQWEWMQRYRVWEANREIFLYPENWLLPELRDNKSYMYSDLEGDLMQSDIDDDQAELAFLNYLKKLDEVARLEIIGMYLEENDLTNQYDDVLHVFGRTNGNTRAYYYRKFAGGAWTPWEKVGLTLEGDNVFPIIWKNRLFLFWLNFVTKAKQPDGTETPQAISNDNWGDQVKKDVEINVCWGEYYNGKWTSPKSTELLEPVVLESLSSFDARNVMMYGRKDQPDPKKSEHLIFYLIYVPDTGNMIARSVTFTSKNCPPILGDVDSNDSLVQNVALFNYELYRKNYEGSSPSKLNGTTLKIPGANLKMLIDQPSLAASPTVSETVLTKNGMFDGFKLLPLRHPVQNQWQSPFVYHDEQSIFLVQPKEADTPPLWIYTGYYDGGMTLQPNYSVYIPPLVEKPVYTVPTPGYPDPLQPVMDTSGWDQPIATINSNYKTVLPSAVNFTFDKASIGAGGITTNFAAQRFQAKKTTKNKQHKS